MINRKRYLSVLILLLVSGLLSAYLQLRGENPARAAALPRALPMNTSGWQGSPLTVAMPKEVGPEDYILRSYLKSGDRQVNMLAMYSPISDYHRPAICYRGSGHQLTEVPALSSSSGKIRLAGLMGKRDGNTILIYHGFFISGRMMMDGVGKKLYEMRENLTRGYIEQYFFEVTIDVVDNDVAGARSYIKGFLDDVENYLLRPERG